MNEAGFWMMIFYLVLLFWIIDRISQSSFWGKRKLRRRIRKNMKSYTKRMIDLREERKVKEE